MGPDICIYHAPCQDGFTAAWAIWKRWPDCEFVPGVYGAVPPDVTGKHVLLVDFSYKRPVIEALRLSARSITIIDHHKSAEADLAEYRLSEGGALASFATLDAAYASAPDGPATVQALFDMTKSGAMLAWEWALPGAPAPWLVRHVQDRDLWTFHLTGTRAICADLFSRDYDFATWSDLAAQLATEDGTRRLIAGGEAIERKHHKDIAELLAICTREMVIGGHRVKVANLPYTLSSDAAGLLAEGMPFGACYYENSKAERVFSLRSRAGGLDVSTAAVAYGGGGHAAAAGFTAPPAWEGDRIPPETDPEDDDTPRCFACRVPFKDGDMVFFDHGEGSDIHADCCGPERESFVTADGEPLAADDPLPQPHAWKADPHG